MFSKTSARLHLRIGKRVVVLVSSVLLLFVAVPALPVTTTNLNQLTPLQLAQMLAGPGVTVSNVRFTGANVAGGSFTGGLADGLGIDSGVILSSGDIANATGPNLSDGITGVNETPGDEDLNAIVGEGNVTFDAAVLEFDFVPSSNTVSFRYVFASDEYNEYVGLINDVFAFYIDGQNVALVPGTTTPIAINTVNLQTNSAFYRNNDPSDLGTPTPFGTQFDGFTTVLTATATLTPKVSHHIKLAIADTTDNILDSAVFLQAASFVSQNLTIAKSAPSTVTSGANLTYTITYGNAGNSAATNVLIRDPIPAGTSFVSATNGGTFQDNNQVLWNIGTLGAGVTGQTVSFTVRVNATSGTITNSNYTIAATDVATVTGSPVVTTIQGVECPTITLSPATLPGATVSTPYSQTITATGGSAPYAFSLASGTLPPGLNVSAGGILSGTPTTAGTFSFTIRALDANECSGTRSYTVTISPGCPAISLSPASLPDGALGFEYSQTITATAGTAPFSFSISSGNLPPGLNLSSSGILSGTPTAGGSYTFTVRVFDANQCTGTRTYTLAITGGCGTVTISPPVLFEGFVGVPYNRTLHGSGGFPPYSFSVTSGALPPGLSLSSGGGISGTPTAEGTFTFRVRAADSSGCTGSQRYTVSISCPPVLLSPATLPAASQGVAYVQSITALGSGGPYTFSAGTGLPAGLTLTSSGAFSGAPTQTGTFVFTVTATSAGGCSVSQQFSLAVCTGLAISPDALAGAAVGSPYSATITASGGTAPYTFTQAGLPSPLTLSSAGAVSGTPAAAGVFEVTVTATDVNGCSGVRVYTLTICPAIALSPASLPNGVVGAAYSQSLAASGGTAPYAFSAAGLPASLTLSAAGVLSGTPATAGTINVTVTVTDAGGCTGSRTYAITITDAPPVISALTLSPAGAESFTLTVTGSGFVDGAVVVVDGVSYPATFVSPTLLTVVLPGSAVPTAGTLTVTVVNPGATGVPSNPATLTLCEPPEAPVAPTIEALGNPTGPLTATDFLLVRWQPPASGPAPSAYEFRINGDPYTTVVGGTSAIAPPRGSNDPITLHVRAKCNDSVTGPEATSQTYSLAPPVADFTFSAARVGSPVNFTDTSSPQATSWLWIFDDGTTSTVQSPSHTFTTAGTHQVALIASNGSGSSTRVKDVVVSAAGTTGSAATHSLRSFEASTGERWTLRWVPIVAGGPAILEIASAASEEAVVYLRFLDGEGRLALERRLVIAPGRATVNDVGSYGLEGLYTLEIVSGRRIRAVLAQPFEPPVKSQEGPR